MQIESPAPFRPQPSNAASNAILGAPPRENRGAIAAVTRGSAENRSSVVAAEILGTAHNMSPVGPAIIVTPRTSEALTDRAHIPPLRSPLRSPRRQIHRTAHTTTSPTAAEPNRSADALNAGTSSVTICAAAHAEPQTTQSPAYAAVMRHLRPTKTASILRFSACANFSFTTNDQGRAFRAALVSPNWFPVTAVRDCRLRRRPGEVRQIRRVRDHARCDGDGVVRPVRLRSLRQPACRRLLLES
jgi:hypothetical protein